jgi:predicted deacetylase
MVQYLIRLDDLCPTNNLPKWERFFELFDRYNIKPIIAAIPKNRDPKLIACGSFNPNYWELVRRLQSKGYIIGMHGFEHRYENGNSGLLKINKRSEFAGLPFYIQQRKLVASAAIFQREGVHTPVFIAPAHSFDRTTLLVLYHFTKIRIISDGLLKSPYTRLGFNWIPAQLPEAIEKSKDTWTFNYHPETCSDIVFQQLEAFIAKHHKNFVSINNLTYQPYRLKEFLQEEYLIYKSQLREFVKSRLNELRALTGTL